MANLTNPTKVITGVNTRWSYVNAWDPKSINGGAPKYSVSLIIPKDDVGTIYALRRLSLWAGNAYVREPSGMGFWANVVPSFNVNYDGVTIPVTLEVTRVEGGA